jgi:hypothetical protein
MTQTLCKHALTLALTATLAAGGAAFAQSGSSEAKVRTDANAQTAVQDAHDARKSATEAQRAAQQAAADRRAGAVTAEGAAQAEYSAYQANQSSQEAQAAAYTAINAANEANSAKTTAHGGTVVPKEATMRGQQAATRARVAGEAARAAAGNAALAASEAQQAVTAPPEPPSPTPVTPTGPTEPLVTVTSSPPDSVVGDYKIDMATMDSNGDGSLSRSEASANATLTAEFNGVDMDHNGRLSAKELSGWMR